MLEKNTKHVVVIWGLFLEKRRNYKNAVSGIFNIWKTEGFSGLWRGAMPTMGRAAIVNGAQLGTYTKAKMLLRDTGY